VAGVTVRPSQQLRRSGGTQVGGRGEQHCLRPKRHRPLRQGGGGREAAAPADLGGIDHGLEQPAAAALAAFAREAPDLLILDVVMSELDGSEVCRRLRRDSQVPVIFLSSRDDEIDRVLGLEMGGDDFVTKPFSPR